MYDIPEQDVVRRRETPDGRFILFTDTDLPADGALPWFGVTCDVGGDAIGFLATVAPSAGAWGALDLIEVARARALVELEHRYSRFLTIIADRLTQALHRLGGARRQVRFSPGPMPSCFCWTVVELDEHRLDFQPTTDPTDEGLTLAQILVVLDQLCRDVRVEPDRRGQFQDVHVSIRVALAAEARRRRWA